MKCPTNSEILTFPTLEDRKEFLTELSARYPAARYATALDPDPTEGDRWLVAIPVDQYKWLHENISDWAGMVERTV